jgi:hypothetical protein
MYNGRHTESFSSIATTDDGAQLCADHADRELAWACHRPIQAGFISET